MGENMDNWDEIDNNNGSDNFDLYYLELNYKGGGSYIKVIISLSDYISRLYIFIMDGAL